MPLTLAAVLSLVARPVGTTEHAKKLPEAVAAVVAVTGSPPDDVLGAVSALNRLLYLPPSGQEVAWFKQASTALLGRAAELQAEGSAYGLPIVNSALANFQRLNNRQQAADLLADVMAELARSGTDVQPLLQQLPASLQSRILLDAAMYGAAFGMLAAGDSAGLHVAVQLMTPAGCAHTLGRLIKDCEWAHAAQFVQAAAEAGVPVPPAELEAAAGELFEADQHAEVISLAELASDSVRLWQLAVLSSAQLGRPEAAVQLAATGAPPSVSEAERLQLLVQLALQAAAGGQAGLSAPQVELLTVACAAAGFEGEHGSGLADTAVQLWSSMSAAGQQPSLPACRAALAGVVHLARAGQAGLHASSLLRMLQGLLAEQPQLAAELGDGEWDAVLAAALGSSSSSTTTAPLVAQLLVEHGPLLAAVSRQQRWSKMLQLAAAAEGAAAGPARAEVVAQWTAAAAAGQAPAPTLSFGMRMALMGAHHTPEAELQAPVDPVLAALSTAGRTAELLQALPLLQSASGGAYRPTARHMSDVLLSARASPLWAAGTGQPPGEAPMAQQQQRPIKRQAEEQAAWQTMCAALLRACEEQLGAPEGGARGDATARSAGVGWAAQLSPDAQQVLLRVLRWVDRGDDLAQFCLLADLKRAPQEEAASAINAALAHAFTHSHQQRWLELAAAALELPQFAAAHAAAHEAAAAATVAGGNFGAGWEALCSQHSRWGMQPRASTLTVALRCLAGQLAEAAEAGGAAAAEKVLHRAELSGLALAAAPQQPGGGQPPVAPLPPLGPAVLEALLAVYAAAADAGVHHSAEVAALAAAAAQQGQVLTPGSSLALLTCWEAAEGGAGSGGGASAQPAARALRPLLEQLFGEEAVAEVETAAYADAEARLPSPACTVEEALAAVATAAGAATAAWELQGLQQVEPAGEEEQQPRAASNRLSADVLAALRRGKLSAGVLAACRSLDQSSLLEELSALEKRGRLTELEKAVGLGGGRQHKGHAHLRQIVTALQLAPLQ